MKGRTANWRIACFEHAQQSKSTQYKPSRTEQAILLCSIFGPYVFGSERQPLTSQDTLIHHIKLHGEHRGMGIAQGSGATSSLGGLSSTLILSSDT